MANYDSNYAIAQEISARIGVEPIPFNSVYDIALSIYQELGGEEDNFDSVYSILLEILPLVEGGIADKVIDDNSIVLNKTWSSSKINSMIADAGFKTAFVNELPESGDTHTIYFIPSTNPESENARDEFMWTGSAWEQVGSTNVDLTEIINDTTVDTDTTWSSEKINSEISAIAGTANPEIEGKESIDFIFVAELPASGETDAYVIINGENVDTLYKYVEGEWVVQTPDANKLYFDTENEALYSYVTAEHQFAPVSMVNTIVVGSNLNSNTALKAIKTPGVYSVVQRLHNATKGDYVKNWTLTVESVDYEEYDRSDSIYQKLVNNYTIQKRTWSATRASNDGWSSFSTYYAGEIKDSTTSKYYTWSSNKISSELANIPQLEAGENISVEDGKINALGYKYDSDKKSFSELPNSLGEKQEFLMDYGAQIPNFEILFSGDANATTYTLGGSTAPMMAELAQMPPQFLSMFFFTFEGGVRIGIVSATVDETTGVVSMTLDETLDADNPVSNLPCEGFWAKLDILISGAANVTTYNYVDTTGIGIQFSNYIGQIIKLDGYTTTPVILSAVDGEGSGTITLSETFDSDNAVSNTRVDYLQEVVENKAIGEYSHAEGRDTEVYGTASHAEGYGNVVIGNYSHAEGQGYHNIINATKTYSLTQGSNLISGDTAGIKVGYIFLIDDEYCEVTGITESAIGTDRIFDTTKTITTGLVQVTGVAYGNQSHVEGGSNVATGYHSHAECYNNRATGNSSHAEGSSNIASGGNSHAEGIMTTASGVASHTEGYQTLASAPYSHAEGYICEIYSDAAFGHVEGEGCMVSARHGHAEGRSSMAYGDCAHAEGRFANSHGEATHSEGWYTEAQNRGEHSEGMYNLSHTGSTVAEKTIHSVGIGSGSEARSNAQEVMQNGDIYMKGVGGYQGTDTKAQDNNIKTVQEVINSKADAYEVATNAEIDALFS